MKKLNIRAYIVLGFLFFISFSFAQIETQNNNVWFHYVGKNKIAPKTLQGNIGQDVILYRIT